MPLMPRSLKQFKRQAGTSLIEVLVSLLVLSGGMMGMAGLQSVSLRANQNAFFRTQATTMTLDIVERMRSNLAAVEAGDYNDGGSGATASCFTVAGCSDTQMAAQDILDWSATVAAALPAGDSVVCLDASPNDGVSGADACSNTGAIYAIKIYWDGDRSGDADELYVTTFQPL
jgi:type IV pilus assembly protein PilV